MNLEGRSLDKRGVALYSFMVEARETVFVKVGENESSFTTGNVNVSRPCTYIIQEQRREGSSEPLHSWWFFYTKATWRFQFRANSTTSGLVRNSLGFILSALTDCLQRMKSLRHWRSLSQLTQNTGLIKV